VRSSRAIFAISCRFGAAGFWKGIGNKDAGRNTASPKDFAKASDGIAVRPTPPAICKKPRRFIGALDSEEVRDVSVFGIIFFLILELKVLLTLFKHFVKFQ
jgi:hypothetical protein